MLRKICRLFHIWYYFERKGSNKYKIIYWNKYKHGKFVRKYDLLKYKVS